MAVMAPPAVGRGDTSLCAQRSRTCERNGNEPQPVAPVTRQPDCDAPVSPPRRGARTLAHHVCATAAATGEPRAPRVKRAGAVRACCGAGRTRSAGPCKWREPYLGRRPFDAQVGEAARHIRAAVPDVEEDGRDVPVGQRLGPAPLPTPTRLRAHGHTYYRNTRRSTKHERRSIIVKSTPVRLSARAVHPHHPWAHVWTR